MKTKYLLQFMLIMLAFTSCEKFKSDDAYLNSLIFKKENNVNFHKDVEMSLDLGHYSAVLIPYDTDFTRLVPSIDFDGKSISPKSGETADFSKSMKFVITAENNSTSVNEIKMIKTCSYFFDSNGGSYIEPIAVEQGKYLYYKPEDPMLKNHELVEWITEDGTPWDFEKGKNITENVYLKAKWQYDTVSEDGNWKVEYDGATSDAIIVEYIGDESVESLEIPATINERKVVEIKGRYYVNPDGKELGMNVFNELSNETVKNIDLSKAVYLTRIGVNAFERFYELTEVKLPPNLKIIEDNTFLYCGKLSVIDLPESLSQIEKYVFHGCELTSIKFPSSLVIIGEGAFIFNYIGNVDLSQTKVSEIHKSAFRSCGITSLKLPNTSVYIGVSAFKSNELKKLDLSNTQVSEIDNYAFAGCSIEEVKFPQTLRSVNHRALENNSTLTKITITRSEIPLTVFDPYTFFINSYRREKHISGATIYYPSGTDYPNMEYLKDLDVEWIEQ